MQSLNQTRWKQTFGIKNVYEDLNFAMIIKKVDTSFLGGAKGAKTSDFGAILRFKPLICQSVATNPIKLAEKLYFCVLQLPTKFQAKILTGKFYLGRNQNIHQVAEQFSSFIFGHNFPTSLPKVSMVQFSS